jgi:anti-sigma regulatory factor (Ser/Thr protein kinase)
VRVTLSIFRDRVYLTVSDRGRGFDRRSICVDADNAEGLGLILLHALMDEVSLHSTEHGTSIRLVKRIRPG